MGGTPDRSREFPKPFLIETDGEGAYSLTLRTGRYNSQNYPVITSTRVEATFPTTAAARAYAKENFAANAGEFEFPRKTK